MELEELIETFEDWFPEDRHPLDKGAIKSSSEFDALLREHVADPEVRAELCFYLSGWVYRETKERVLQKLNDMDYDENYVEEEY